MEAEDSPLNPTAAAAQIFDDPVTAADPNATPPPPPPSSAAALDGSPSSILAPGTEIQARREEEVTLYLTQCKDYGLPVDPTVVIILRSGSARLLLHEGVREGCLLPLWEVLRKSTTITTVRLFPVRPLPHGVGDSNAKVIADVLRVNTTITRVDLSKNGISAEGIADLADALRVNHTLEKLSVRDNHFRPTGGLVLAKALKDNKGLRTLDVSNNALGFACTQALRYAAQHSDHVVGDNGNYVIEEILNSVTHGFGAVVSLLASVVLLYQASQSRAQFWSCFVYCMSLITLYVCSTLYHGVFLLPRAHHVMQIIDHAAIYLLIAGSYTPFLAVSMAGVPEAMGVMAAEWILAAIGVVVSIYVINSRKWVLTLIEVVLYVGMGWMVVVLYKDLTSRLGDGMPLLLAGGICYSLGVAVFFLDLWHPMWHPVFHLFVMAGSTLHYFAILFYVAWGPVVPYSLARSILGLTCDAIHTDAANLGLRLQTILGCAAQP